MLTRIRKLDVVHQRFNLIRTPLLIVHRRIAAGGRQVDHGQGHDQIGIGQVGGGERLAVRHRIDVESLPGQGPVQMDEIRGRHLERFGVRGEDQRPAVGAGGDAKVGGVEGRLQGDDQGHPGALLHHLALIPHAVDGVVGAVESGPDFLVAVGQADRRGEAVERAVIR